MRNLSSGISKVGRFQITGYNMLGKVGVRAITYNVPHPRPRYFISAAGTLPYLPYRWWDLLLTVTQPFPAINDVQINCFLHTYMCGFRF